MSMTEKKKDFFISYNGKDKDWAEWIAWQLEDTGYSVVIQAWDFRPGGNFVLEMQKAAQAERTLVVLSPNYLAAQFTQPEWAAAFAQDPTGEKGISLPVRVAECNLQGLLPVIIYIDLVDLVVSLNFRDEPRANWGTIFLEQVAFAIQEARPGKTTVRGLSKHDP